MPPVTIKVLIVDDDPDFAKSLELALGIRKCQVDVAYSGEDAMRIFNAGHYDLVFMDIKLPGKNGVQTLTDMLASNPQTRVVMITGFSEPALLNTARQAGAWDVLCKPFKIRHLFGYLEGLPRAES